LSQDVYKLQCIEIPYYKFCKNSITVALLVLVEVVVVAFVDEAAHALLTGEEGMGLMVVEAFGGSRPRMLIVSRSWRR
jgi:hypothetical protein